MKVNKQSITKTLSIGVVLMGLIHIGATFSPLIAGKLVMLPEGAQGAFTYFSLMCGTLLVLGGSVAFSLSGKMADYPFIRKPYIMTIAVLSVAGILAVCFMSRNPFAWIIFALTMGLMFANVTRFKVS